MPYHLPAAQLAKNLAFHNLPPSSPSSSSSSSFFVPTEKTATTPASTPPSALQVRRMDPSTVSLATTALTTLGRGGHVQRITATGTSVAESLELNRSVGRHGKVKKSIGYLEVEDDTGSAIEITSTPHSESPESSGSHHRHASLTGAMKASTFSCPSTVKNTATTSATTPTDGADPFRFLKPNRRAEGQGHNSTAPLRNYLHAPSPAAVPDLDPPILASPSLPLAPSTFGHPRNDNGNRANNNPNAPSDRTTLLLPSLLFLVVGVLSYALYKYLYTYFPPHILPCVDSPPSLRGWSGQRLPRCSHFLGHDEREGDDYGWPSSTYCLDHAGTTDHNAAYGSNSPHPGGLSSSPPPQLQQQEENRYERKPCKFPALALVKARIMCMLLHRRRNAAKYQAGAIGTSETSARDLEAGHLLATLPTSSRAQDLRAEGAEPPKARSKNPFDCSPTPTPSPLLPITPPFPSPASGADESLAVDAGGEPSFFDIRRDRRTGSNRSDKEGRAGRDGGRGRKHEEEWYELESPLGLSRYFEDEGVGIKDM